MGEWSMTINMINQDIGWNFPKNEGGPITGHNDSGIETFAGTPYESLSREVCQNSLDARIDKEKTVRVVFNSFQIQSTQLPGGDDLKSVFRSCAKYWDGNKKTVDFCRRGEEILSNKHIQCLRVSDYNTTGVVGSEIKKVHSAKDMKPWIELVRTTGVSNKDSSSGGSFGIGKTASFATSELRTVFYNTFDMNGISGFQGVSMLTSFSQNSYTTQGTGYYGNKLDNSALGYEVFFENGYRRGNETGTDIYIIGFNIRENWNDRIIKAILEDFLLAIYWGHLEVQIDDFIINRDNLEEIVATFDTNSELKLKYAKNYYEVITAEDKIIYKRDFYNMGEVELIVRLKPDYHRKVLISRISGMKLFDKANISGSIGFAGIALLKGEKLNAYFREMENPQHNAWKEDLSKDKNAKKYTKELYKWIKEQISGLGIDHDAVEIDVAGAGDFLPDEIVDIKSGEEKSKNEIISEKTQNIDIKKDDKIQKQSKRIYKTGSLSDIDGQEEIDDSDSDDSFKMSPEGQPNNTKGGIGTAQPTVGSNGADGKHAQREIIGLMGVRIVRIDQYNNFYRIVLTPNINAEDAVLKIFLSGETINEPVPIKRAFLQNYGSQLVCGEFGIKIGSIRKEEQITITYEIDYDEYCAMEVNLVGYKTE